MTELFINIGTEKCCLFLDVSNLLIRKLREKPLLYYAVEEALECAKVGHFGIAILAFSQIVNLFNEPAPEERHAVAHEFLTRRPTHDEMQTVLDQLKKAARRCSNEEIGRAQLKGDVEYRDRILRDWKSLVAQLHCSKR